MHRFLTAFLCLSTLAMTQNVVAGTPNPVGDVRAAVAVRDSAADRLASGSALSQATVGGEVPSPGTMLLLVTGLAGLSAVGNRRAAPVRIASR
ncbi:hypothetical protein K2X89_06010 [Myxococcota bacterium]|nr:hypothetical protein [Myxococcota bacterium]